MTIAPPPTSGKTLLSSPQPQLSLYGDYQSGGPLEAMVDGLLHPITVDLVPIQWTLLAEQMLAAILANHWRDAYVKSKRLAERLDDYEVSATPDTNTVHKNINGLRRSLARSGIQQHTPDSSLDPMAWAKLLIHTKPRWGYRVTVPREQLALYIGNVEYSVRTAPEFEGKDDESDENNGTPPSPK